jgi:acyl-CoA synthetase (AMP-forming)/AMP-acid ligase II
MNAARITQIAPDNPPDICSLLARGAAEHPEKVLFTHLRFDGREPQLTTYDDVYSRARTIAALFATLNLHQRPVLLVFPPGTDFAPAFFGALLARAIAVPAPAPQFASHFHRLGAIAADCRPGALMATEEVLAKLQNRMPPNSPLRACPWLTSGSGVDDSERPTTKPGHSSEIAILQYTSGSTGSPRGVMVTHGNLAHNVRMIERVFDLPSGARNVSWLPHTHDMGLISGFVAPLACRGESVLMSPQSFIQRPLRWLEAISHYRAQVCGAPNFAYEHCARWADRTELPPLDLSSWRTAFVGAEPIRFATMQRFVDRFRASGFDPSALTPCYGMAEATVMICCKPAHRPPNYYALSREALKTGRAEHSTENPSLILTGCGHPAPGTEIRIVEPGSLKPVDKQAVGEVWVAGPQVARGYWGEGRGEIFGAALADSDDERFLRTGDLGFLTDDGELVFVERLKDVIVLNGQNYICHDLETSASRSHRLLSADGCIAVSVEEDDKEQVLLIAELPVDATESTDAVAREIRAAWFTDFGLSPSRIVFVPPGKLSRTTSGKLQRRLTAGRLMSGELRALASDCGTLPKP